MKLIVALVLPEKLHAVLTVLNGRQVCVLAVGNVLAPGQGRAENSSEPTIGGPQTWVRVEIASNDEAADKAVEAIARAHGSPEDGQPVGKVFVTRLEAYEELRSVNQDPVVIRS